jgi:uncharacterized protein (TIGR00369 family)
MPLNAPFNLYKQILEDLIPFHQVLGLKLLEVKENFVSILVPFKPELIGDPRKRVIHGGVLASVMDAAGGAAGITTLKSFEDRLSTIDLRIDYLQPGKGEDIVCEGTIVRSGSRVIFTRMICYNQTKPEEIIAEGKGVYSVKRHHNQASE